MFWSEVKFTVGLLAWVPEGQERDAPQPCLPSTDDISKQSGAWPPMREVQAKLSEAHHEPHDIIPDCQFPSNGCSRRPNLDLAAMAITPTKFAVTARQCEQQSTNLPPSVSKQND